MQRAETLMHDRRYFIYPGGRLITIILLIVLHHGVHGSDRLIAIVCSSRYPLNMFAGTYLLKDIRNATVQALRHHLHAAQRPLP